MSDKTPAVYYKPNSLDTSIIKHMQIAGEQPGDIVHLVDGSGKREVAKIDAISKTNISYHSIKSVVDKSFSPKITLVQAILKGGHDIEAIEACTQIGVNEILPWNAARSISRWKDTAKQNKGQRKWQDCVISAMEQSRQSFLPQIKTVCSSKQLIEIVHEWVKNGNYCFVGHEKATTGFSEHLQKLLENKMQVLSDSKFMLIIGPEGGITPEELEGLESSKALPVLFGNTILRSGTASIVACALLRSFLNSISEC